MHTNSIKKWYYWPASISSILKQLYLRTQVNNNDIDNNDCKSQLTTSPGLFMHLAGAGAGWRCQQPPIIPSAVGDVRLSKRPIVDLSVRESEFGFVLGTLFFLVNSLRLSHKGLEPTTCNEMRTLFTNRFKC